MISIRCKSPQTVVVLCGSLHCNLVLTSSAAFLPESITCPVCENNIASWRPIPLDAPVIRADFPRSGIFLRPLSRCLTALQFTVFHDKIRSAAGSLIKALERILLLPFSCLAVCEARYNKFHLKFHSVFAFYSSFKDLYFLSSGCFTQS